MKSWFRLLQLFLLAILISQTIIPATGFAQKKSDSLSVGDEAPKFLLRETTTNEATYLSDYVGKTLRQPWKKQPRHVVVVSFWATWCEPCKIEIPLLMSMSEEFKNQPVKIFLVNTKEDRKMTEDSIRAVMNRRGYTLPCLLDATGTVADRYGVRGLPMIVVIDKFGIVRKVNRGYHENFHVEIAELIRELLKEDETVIAR
jgi:thiol-disulfide isomerase/thioredoxin